MAQTKTPLQKVNYLERYLIEELVEDYQEGHLSRREMIRRALLITGSVPLTASILLSLGCGSSTSPTNTPAAAVATATSPAAAAVSPTAAPTRAATAASPTGGASPTRAATAAGAASPAGSPRAGSPGATPNPVTGSPTDPAIEAGPGAVPGKAGTIKGYKSQPKGATKAPGIIVIHQNRGLEEHTKDITRRYAKDGFVAVAVDLLSRLGGTDTITDPGQIQAGLRNANDLADDLVSGVAYLKGLPNFMGPKAGAVGYCFGGNMAWLLATRSTDLGAAIPYYGTPPDPIDDLQKVTAAVLAFYGENDQRVTGTQPAAEATMRKYNKTFQYVVYPGAGHAFNDDTRPEAYNAAAAKDAYQRSLDWFNKYLKG